MIVECINCAFKRVCTHVGDPREFEELKANEAIYRGCSDTIREILRTVYNSSFSIEIVDTPKKEQKNEFRITSDNVKSLINTVKDRRKD